MTQCRTADGKPKKRYDTRAEAKAERKRYIGLGWADAVENEPYRCPECGYFHLGRYPKDLKAREGLRAKHHPGGTNDDPTRDNDRPVPSASG